MQTAGRFVFGLAILGVFLASGIAEAQVTGALTGAARDTTGAMLPGVTVEVTSPALIEKVRSTVTGDQGRFNVVDLPPGVYTVTFTLTGFSTFRLEAVELSAGFTATANADMKVGALEETVTVTGASPTVDIQNVRTQQVVRREVFDALPSGMKDIQQLAAMTLGASVSQVGQNDVGGSSAEAATSLVIHGSRGDDVRVMWDGMNANTFNGSGGGQYRAYHFNMIAVQETVVDTSSATAESETGGANVNMIPRDGGNTFSVHTMLSYAGQSLASGKVSDALIARGSAPDQNSVKRVYDYGVGLGGPIKRDRAWFYSANRVWGGEAYGANNYYNKSPVWYRYEPDLSRQAYSNTWQRDFGGRLTWQASAKQKVTATLHRQRGCVCGYGIGGGALTSPEASGDYQYGSAVGEAFGGVWLSQGRWTYPATNHVLVQVATQYLKQPKLQTNFHYPGPNDVSIIEQTTGYRWGSVNNFSYDKGQTQNNFTQAGSASYVSGAHVLKVGGQIVRGRAENNKDNLPNGTSYTFRNGLPLTITENASPFLEHTQLRSQAVFAQEQWTLQRLTLNAGLRLDRFKGAELPADIPAGPFIAERHYPAVDNLPSYSDITPRLGAAYDVFGNGRTAIKGAWGRYLKSLGAGHAQAFSPSQAILQNTTRQWTDGNANFIPDCVLTNPLANGECGTIANLAFGSPIAVTRLDERARTGWGLREFNYQTSVALQHELTKGIGLTIAYTRTDWRNQIAIVNSALTAADYTPYCITAPTDARLGAFSGRPVCGLFDENPAKAGQVANVLMLAKQVPDAKSRPQDVFNGVDIGMTARFGRGALVQGGVTLGRTTFDYCWANDLPNVQNASWGPAYLTNTYFVRSAPKSPELCRLKSALWNGTGSQIKFQAVYPLPYDVVVSGTFKHLPGVPIIANYTATNAQVSQSLGRDLSACRGAVPCTQTVTVGILPNGFSDGNSAAALFDQRITQVDMRLARAVRVGGVRLNPTLDVYNVFNNRPPVAINTTYGATFMKPTGILGGRLVAFGAQIDF